MPVELQPPKPPERLAVQRRALRLHIGADRPAEVLALLPIQPEPAKIGVDLPRAPLDDARLVEVLVAHDKVGARQPRLQPGQKRGARVPQVQRAGGTRRVAGARFLEAKRGRFFQKVIIVHSFYTWRKPENLTIRGASSIVGFPRGACIFLNPVSTPIFG